MQVQYKVSMLGWLCVMRMGNWIPVCKLNDEQMKNLLEVLNLQSLE